MSRIFAIYGLFLLLCSTAVGQVGIGTASISPSAILQLESTKAAFVLPRMTDTQMTAITSPLPGAMVFNNSENLPYFSGASGWSSFDINSNPTIILHKSGGTIPTSTTLLYPLNVTDANAISTSSAYFTVDSPGTITVSRPGVYLMSACLSTSNMPAGSRNYSLGIYKGSTLIGYLSKSKLENPSADYWGTTGTIMYYANAGDQFSFKYFIANATTLAGVFQTICITKLN